MRSWFRLATFFAIVVLLMTYYGAGATGLLGGALGASPSPSLSACSSNVTVQATNYVWTSNDGSGSAIGEVCKTVTFNVVNTGSTPHTFTVSNLVNKTDTSSTDSSFFSWPNLYYSQALNASGSAGGTLTVKITFGAQGAYEYTCIPHYGLGMFGEIYVLEAPPAPPPPAPAFEAFWYIVIAVTGLAVLSVVLGIIYGKRGAHPDALPPRGIPITSRPEYFNDSRPEPLDSADPRLTNEPEH